MRTATRNIWILAVSICAAIGGKAAGERLPTLSVRDMTIQAQLIVVGVPLDSKTGVFPTRYTVVDVLKGTGIRAGEKILLNAGRLYGIGSGSTIALKGKNGSLRIKKALLFLRRSQADAVQDGYWLVLSGIRAMAEDGQLLVRGDIAQVLSHGVGPLDAEFVNRRQACQSKVNR